jgi:nickel-dependent lactate racemase
MISNTTDDAVLGAGDPTRLLDQEEIFSIVARHADNLGLDGQRLLVLIPDNTRTAPLPLMFDALRAAFGDRVAALDLLIALGTHPPMTEAAIDELLGRPASERGGSRVFNHEWDRPETFVSLGVIDEEEIDRISGGRLRQKVDVRINKLVTEYDHVLVCGPVFPHEVVGFSGGNKYFYPGVSGKEVIDLSHWLGALITSYEIIGTLGITPVRAVIDKAAAMIPTPRSALCFVVATTSNGLHGLYAGTPEQAWAEAAKLSSQVHVRYVDRQYSMVLSVIPEMYDEIWVAAKGMYKLEPVVSDGGEIILYAPHVRHVSRVHGEILQKIGYHSRDYFLAHWDEFQDVPWGVLAHATHLTGAGTYDPVRREERKRIKVTLATGIPEQECTAIGLGYLDPATVDVQSFAGRESEGVLLVPKAGEMLYRLR